MWNSMIHPRDRRNPNFCGSIILSLAFCQLILALLLLAAQIAFFSFWDFGPVNCLIFPGFISAILGILAGGVGLAAGIEKTEGLICWYLILGCLVIVSSAVFLGIGSTIDELEEELFPVVLDGEDAGGTGRALVFFSLFIIPIVLAVLFLITCCVGIWAICCPSGDILVESSPIIHPAPILQQKPFCPSVVQPQVIQQPFVQPQVIQQPQIIQQPFIQPQVIQQPIVQPQIIQQPIIQRPQILQVPHQVLQQPLSYGY